MDSSHDIIHVIFEVNIFPSKTKHKNCHHLPHSKCPTKKKMVKATNFDQPFTIDELFKKICKKKFPFKFTQTDGFFRQLFLKKLKLFQDPSPQCF